MNNSVPTSSSEFASNSAHGKIVVLDSSNNGPSEGMNIEVEMRNVQAESSYMGHVNNSKNEHVKGIHREAFNESGDFDETIGGNGACPKILETESSGMAGINNLHIIMQNETQGAESSDMAGIDNLQIIMLNGTHGAVMEEMIPAASINQEDRSESVVGVRDMECGCCCFELLSDNIVQCADGHLFCFRCLQRQVEEIIYGNLKAQGSLPCMNTDGCKESIPLSEVQRALPNDVIERYEQRQVQEAIIHAKVLNLVNCPFCGIPCEVDKCVEVFDCPNPKCLVASCIQCKEASHVPLSCEENEKTSGTAPRRKIEERMTKAVIRECKTCKAEIVKLDGCNRLTCSRCRTTMCYVCRQTLSSAYNHFCDHCYTREQGKPCQICNNKCSLWENEVADNVALDAKEEALKELVDRVPNLLDQKIGPPLVKQTQLPNPLLRLRVAQDGREGHEAGLVQQLQHLDPDIDQQFAEVLVRNNRMLFVPPQHFLRRVNRFAEGDEHDVIPKDT
jgi:hypothetical protein